MEKDTWNCEINGEKCKIIKKKKDGVEWWKCKPLKKGYTKGVHIVSCSGEPLSAHQDEFLNQRELGKLRNSHYQVSSVATSPNGDYISTSGAVTTYVVPLERCLKHITVRNCSGPTQIVGNTSGYVGYVNIYPEY